MASLEEIKKQKAEDLARKMKEEEERAKKEASEKHTIKTFFEQELEKEIRKTGFYKRLFFVSPMIVFLVMLGLGVSYFYFRDIMVKRDADAEAYAIEAVGKATATAVNQVGTALKQNPDYVPLITAQKWDGRLPHSMVSGQNPPFINAK
jgi:hypothetical protein